MTVYLLHFDAPYYHAAHYVGCTENLDKRLARHQAGRGSHLMKAVRKAGIGWKVAAIWEGGRELEKHLKARHQSSDYCPICKEARSHAVL